MAPSIRIREELESFYKLKTVLVISGVLTFLLENHYIKFLEDPALSARFVTFFANGSLLGLYGTLIGLLLTAYAMFQVAEERPPGGALGLIKAGVLDNVDYVLGQHVLSTLPAGQVATYKAEPCPPLP